MRGVPKTKAQRKRWPMLGGKNRVWLGSAGEAVPRAFGSRPFLAPTVIKVLVAGYSAARPEEKAHN